MSPMAEALIRWDFSLAIMADPRYFTSSQLGMIATIARTWSVETPTLELQLDYYKALCGERKLPTITVASTVLTPMAIEHVVGVRDNTLYSL
jgi:hypothetical protein